MKPASAHLKNLTWLLLAVQPLAAHACSACYGQQNTSSMASGFNWGVLSLLGVVIFVLGCCVGFVAFLMRRAAAAAASATPEELEAARAEFSVGFTPMVQRTSGTSTANHNAEQHPDAAIAPGRGRRLLRRGFRTGNDAGPATERAIPAGAQHSPRRKGHSSNRF